MERDKTVKIHLDCRKEMELVKEQAEILGKDPEELFKTLFVQSLQKQAKERGMKLRCEFIDDKSKGN